jgi:aconitate hydratase
MQDSFRSRRKLAVEGRTYDYYALDALAEYGIERLPYSLKILLENLLRHEDGRTVTRDDIVALASADPRKLPQHEIATSRSLNLWIRRWNWPECCTISTQSI